MPSGASIAYWIYLLVLVVLLISIVGGTYVASEDIATTIVATLAAAPAILFTGWITYVLYHCKERNY